MTYGNTLRKINTLLATFSMTYLTIHHNLAKSVIRQATVWACRLDMAGYYDNHDKWDAIEAAAAQLWGDDWERQLAATAATVTA